MSEEVKTDPKEEVSEEEAKDKEAKKKAADNPKGHSIEYLSEKAAKTRWVKYSGRTKVAEACEISPSLLEDVNRSPQYREAVKQLMLTDKPALETVRWIERYGESMPQRFGRYMSLDPETVKELVKEVQEAVAPQAAREAEAEKKAKAAEAEAKKKKEEADKKAEAEKEAAEKQAKDA